MIKPEGLGSDLCQIQDEVFASTEGDAWFHRNREHLNELVPHGPDTVVDMLGRLPADWLQGISTVCDVGCSNGWRLAGLGKLLSGRARLSGFDASQAAVAAGKSRFADANVELRQGLVDSPPFSTRFDLVVVSFVLHWVDRRRLTRAIAGIDDLVDEDGLLVISDFLPGQPGARVYHHRTDVEMYTYKQDYVRTFVATGLYRVLALATFPHDAPDRAPDKAADQERAVCAILHRSKDAYPCV